MMRALNITLRTAHICSMGILVGGYAFDIVPERLQLVLWLTIGTGIGLAALEAGPRLLWFHQGSGIMTLTKLALLCAVPLAPDYRLQILLAVIVIASVGSHMPGRYRHYSVLYRRVVHDVSDGGKSGGKERTPKPKGTSR